MKKIMSACGGSAVGGKKTLLPLMILALSLVALPSYATTWYVDAQNGIDSPSCTTTTSPCINPVYVLGQVTSGDTVYLKGTFSNANYLVNTNFTGTSTQHSVIAGWPGAADPIFDATGQNQAFVVAGNYIDLKDLTITGGTYSGVRIEGDYISVSNCKFYNNKEQISISNATYAYIINNIIYSGSVGIVAINSSYIYIVNNTIDANNTNLGSAYGIGIVFGGTNNITILNNAISNHARTAIEFGDGLPNFMISNYNDFYNNTQGVARFSGNNYFLSAWQALGYDANSKELNPDFVSTTSGSEDYHLKSTSALIDLGTDASTYTTTDFDGETRPYATAYDIGADELPIPAAPSADAIENQLSTSVTIAWTAPTTATTSYTLEYSSNQDYSDPTTVADITETHYDLTDLSVNTTYYYRIKAVYTTDYASYESDWLSSAPFMTASDAPTALAAADRTSTALDISWTAPAGTILSYSLVYAKDENFTDSSNLLNDISGTSVNIEDLDTNQAYYFTVKAYNGGIDSAYSEILATRTLPAKVTGVKVPVKFRQAHHVKIKWHKAGDDLKYRIKLMNKKGKKIKIYKTTKLKKVIKNLKADKIYKIRVRAKYDANNIGTWSKIVKFRTLAE